MPRYIALIDGAEDAFGAKFPDCPGCTAMGASLDQRLSNAADALREWMADRVADGLSPPQARTAQQFREDPHLADEIDGAIFAAVPLLLDAGRSVRANVSLDAGLLQAIDEAARDRGLTRSAFIASAARQKIAAEG